MASILNVDKIRATGSTTDAITIDTSDRVVFPKNKIAFQAMRTGNITGYDGTVQANEIVFNNEIYDLNGDYDHATGLFTAPVDGIYTFYGGVYMDATVFQIWPLVNDVRQPSLALQEAGGTIMGSAIIKLDANDTVGLKGYTNSTNRIVYANDLHTLFTGCLTLPL